MGRGLRGLVTLALLALWPGGLMASVPWPQGVPSAVEQPVNDLAGMLSKGTQQKLNSGLSAQWKAQRFQLAVLTLRSLEERPIEDVGILVARTWGLGGKESDNGVLLLIAPKERKLRIEVGQKLEGSLTDVACKRIIEDVMKPRLKAGDMDGAVIAGVAAITTQLAPEDALANADSAERPLPELPKQLIPLLFFILGHPLLLLIVFIVLQILLSAAMRAMGLRSPGRRRGGFGGGGWGGGSSGGSWGGGGGGFSGGGGGFSGGGSSGSW